MTESLAQFAFYPIQNLKEKIKNCLPISRRRKTLNPVFNESFKFEVPFQSAVCLPKNTKSSFLLIFLLRSPMVKSWPKLQCSPCMIMIVFLSTMPLEKFVFQVYIKKDFQKNLSFIFNFPLFFALSNCVCFSVCQMDLAQTKEIWKELQSIVGDGKVRPLHDFFITYHYI